MKRFTMIALVIGAFGGIAAFAVLLVPSSSDPTTQQESCMRENTLCSDNEGQLEPNVSTGASPAAEDPDGYALNDSGSASGGLVQSASSNTGQSDQSTLPTGVFRNAVYGSVTSYTDVVYKNSYLTDVNLVDGYYEMSFTSTPRALAMNIYTPTGPKSNRPLIIFVHGGGWRFGDRAQRDPEAIYYSKLGYTTATIDYTLLPEDAPDAELPNNLAYQQVIVEDVGDLTTAYQYLLNNASQYGIDTSKIGLAGWSAGGMNINALTHLDNGFSPTGLRATLASSSIFPSSLSSLFGGFRTFSSSYNPKTLFASNSVDDGGSISFIDDCEYLDSIGHACNYTLLDGVGHDLSFHMDPLKDAAIDFFATNVAGY